MIQPTSALFDVRPGAETEFGAFDEPAPMDAVARADIRLSVHEHLDTIGPDWRAFAQRADGTAFQTHEWLATWQRHIGARNGTRPAVVVARDAAGAILMLMPLSVERGSLVRRLTWLGGKLCDYNAPLLAADFSRQVSAARFRLLWDEILACLRSHPRLGFDLIDLERMPETIGAQRNPMLAIGAMRPGDGAYLVSLAGSWEELYAKRSSATRRHDRSKRQRLAEHGTVRFVSASDRDEIVRTLDTLMAQKARWFAEIGVANMFERPGVRDFFLAVATDADTRAITHISRLEVGDAAAAAGFGLTFGDRYYHVLASYDRSSGFSRFGPGAAHLHELMRFAIGRGYRTFDLSVGQERFKHEWSDRELKLYDHLAAVTARGALALLPMMAMRRIKSFIKNTPALWSRFRRARATAAALRASVRSIGI